MKALEWGTDVSVEGLQEGFSRFFITALADAAGRDAYIPHQAHQDYVKVAAAAFG